MPPRTQQAQKSPRNPKTVKQEASTPKSKTPTINKEKITTPKTPSATASSSRKEPKSEKKTPAAASSSSSTPPKSKVKSARKHKKTQAEKEKSKGILKKESIKKIAKIHGCIRISADVYDKAREMFDCMLSELMNNVGITTQYKKKKQITFQTVNQCAKRLWNINVYNGTDINEVKDMAKLDDGEDYSTDESLGEE